MNRCEAGDWLSFGENISARCVAFASMKGWGFWHISCGLEKLKADAERNLLIPTNLTVFHSIRACHQHTHWKAPADWSESEHQGFCSSDDSASSSQICEGSQHLSHFTIIWDHCWCDFVLLKLHYVNIKEYKSCLNWIRTFDTKSDLHSGYL